MKEFKFWAIPYSFTRLLIFIILFVLLYLVLLSSLHVLNVFGYFFLSALIWNVFFFVFFIKKVQITFSEDGIMRLYINGKEKVVAEPQELELIRSSDVNGTMYKSALYLQLKGQSFVFNIFEFKYGEAGRQQFFVQYMVTTYNLQKEFYKLQKNFYKKSQRYTIYTYRNPLFKSISVSDSDYNKKEK